MEVVTLRSAREVMIRPIRPDDADRLRAAHDRLSPETKYRRFLAPKPHLSALETRYLVDVDGSTHYALVATAVGHPERIIAVGRFVRLPEDPDTAEFAIVVGDPYHREGLATELVGRLADAAAARGVARFRATMLAENVAAQRLVRRLAGSGARHRRRGIVDELDIKLPLAS